MTRIYQVYDIVDLEDIPEDYESESYWIDRPEIFNLGGSNNPLYLDLHRIDEQLGYCTRGHMFQSRDVYETFMADAQVSKPKELEGKFITVLIGRDTDKIIGLALEDIMSS